MPSLFYMKDLIQIILCGGRSSRMGTHKGLLDRGGVPWILKHISDFQKLGGKRLIIVLGYRYEDYFACIPELEISLNCWHDSSALVGSSGLQLMVVVNENFDQGQFSSLQRGLQQATQATEEALCIGVMPVDMDMADADVFRSIIMKSKINEILVVVPIFQGKGGHPVLLNRTFALLLAKLPVDSVDSRLDRQISALGGDSVSRVEVDDPKILININTMEQCK